MYVYIHLNISDSPSNPDNSSELASLFYEYYSHSIIHNMITLVTSMRKFTYTHSIIRPIITPNNPNNPISL